MSKRTDTLRGPRRVWCWLCYWAALAWLSVPLRWWPCPSGWLMSYCGEYAYDESHDAEWVQRP